jgi:hypothetical protein
MTTPIDFTFNNSSLNQKGGSLNHFPSNYPINYKIESPHYIPINNNPNQFNSPLNNVQNNSPINYKYDYLHIPHANTTFMPNETNLHIDKLANSEKPKNLVKETESESEYETDSESRDTKINVVNVSHNTHVKKLPEKIIKMIKQKKMKMNQQTNQQMNQEMNEEIDHEMKHQEEFDLIN